MYVDGTNIPLFGSPGYQGPIGSALDRGAGLRGSEGTKETRMAVRPSCELQSIFWIVPYEPLSEFLVWGLYEVLFKGYHGGGIGFKKKIMLWALQESLYSLNVLLACQKY